MNDRNVRTIRRFGCNRVKLMSYCQSQRLPDKLLRVRRDIPLISGGDTQSDEQTIEKSFGESSVVFESAQVLP
jgi:hypothetical protein